MCLLYTSAAMHLKSFHLTSIAYSQTLGEWGFGRDTGKDVFQVITLYF